MRVRELGAVLAFGAALGCGGHVTTEPAAGGGAVGMSGGGGSAPGPGGEAPSGGSSGAPAPLGGAGGSAGSAVLDEDVNTVAPSRGCAQPLPAEQLLGVFSEYSMAVSGQTLDPAFSVPAHQRKYVVWLPKDYDNTKPYRVTFQYMGCGDRNAAASANYKLMSQDPESIYVAMDMPPAGLPPENRDCFDATVGRQSVEWEFMGLVASEVQKTFCVDEHRLFVAGYSSGASVANMFGCYFAGRDPTRKFGPNIMIRGQSGVTGIPVLPDVPCGGKTAALWIHDADDHENVSSGNQSYSLSRVLAANDCTDGVNGPHAPWGRTEALKSVCTRYTSCPTEYPVVFCLTAGRGHSSQDALAVPGFIEFQDLMNPP